MKYIQRIDQTLEKINIDMTESNPNEIIIKKEQDNHQLKPPDNKPITQNYSNTTNFSTPPDMYILIFVIY